MNQWDYVTAAYAVTAVATLVLLSRAWLAMREAEAEAAKPRR